MMHALLVFAAYYLGIGLLLLLGFLLLHISIGGKFRDLVDAGVAEMSDVPEPSNPAWSRRTSVAIGLVLGVLLKWPKIIGNTIRQLWLKRSQSR